MKSIPENAALADVVVDATLALPRFGDGFINIQEVLRQLAEAVADEIMSEACQDSGQRNIKFSGGQIDLRLA